MTTVDELPSSFVTENRKPLDAPLAAGASAWLVAHNIRRLMAQHDMTYEDVVAASGLDSRTIRGVVRGNQTPQARTLHRLAAGFGAPTDELFAPATGLTPEAFDAATNPIVAQAKRSHPDVFRGWTSEEFTELESRFGVGGELNEDGALAAADQINARREVLLKAKVILETGNAELLAGFIDLLYERIKVHE